MTMTIICIIIIKGDLQMKMTSTSASHAHTSLSKMGIQAHYIKADWFFLQALKHLSSSMVNKGKS